MLKTYCLCQQRLKKPPLTSISTGLVDTETKGDLGVVKGRGEEGKSGEEGRRGEKSSWQREGTVVRLPS